MTTGDPQYPCGHYWYPSDIGDASKCLVCAPPPPLNYATVPVRCRWENGELILKPSEQMTSENQKRRWPNLRDQFDALKALGKLYQTEVSMVHDEVTADLSKVAPEQQKEFFYKLDELMTKQMVDEAIKEWKNDPRHIPILPSPLLVTPLNRPSVGDVNFTGVTTMTGRMSCKGENTANYPREKNEEWCEGCARSLPIDRSHAKTSYTMEHPEWRAFHRLPDKGGAVYYCRGEFHKYKRDTKAYPKEDIATPLQLQKQLDESALSLSQSALKPLNEQFTEADRAKSPAIAAALDSYYAAALKSFTESQRLNDFAPKPHKEGRRLYKCGPQPGKSTAIANKLVDFEHQPVAMSSFGIAPAKEFLKIVPEASYAWSAALRAKIKASEEAATAKQKIEDSRHWDPYLDYDD